MKKLSHSAGKELAKRGLAKRRVNKDLIKIQATQADVRPTKSIVQVLHEKFIYEQTSKFFGFELVYLLAVQRKGKASAEPSKQGVPVQHTNSSSSSSSNNNNNKNNNSSSSSSSGSGASGAGKGHDRYVVMLNKKTDTKSQFYFIQLVFKDESITLKNTLDLSLLKGIDFGSDENELLLSFENADYNIFFMGQNERDETISIIIQVCKQLLGVSDLSIGYSIDVDALNYIATINGTLTRFPLLQKLIQLTGQQGHDLFTEEENEAELLLGELKWSSRGGSHAELQSTLNVQAEVLNTEIIDFLLQWEEDEADSSSSNNNANKAHNNHNHNHSNNHHGTSNNRQPPPRLSSALAAQSPNANSLYSVPAALSGRGMRDTTEVLSALGQVDLELSAVDMWLGEQIERLSEVQHNLRMIEVESGQLETSWHNLNAVKEVVTFLVDGLSISDKEAKLIRHPEDVIGPAIKGTILHDLEQTLQPLVGAVTSLKAALDLKISTSTAADAAAAAAAAASSISKVKIAPPSISAAQWKQLQSLSALTSQKAKLTEMADQFCESFGETSLSVFEWLGKHKFVAEGGKQGHGLSNKQLNYDEMIKNFVDHKVVFDLMGGLSDHSMSTYKALKSSEWNQFSSAQKLYQSCLRPFFPLLNIFVLLSPNSSRLIREAYVRAGSERLVNPLVKVMCKDVYHILSNAPIPWTTAPGVNSSASDATGGSATTTAPSATLSSTSTGGGASSGSNSKLLQKVTTAFHSSKYAPLSLSNCAPYVFTTTIRSKVAKAPIKFLHTPGSPITPWMGLQLLLGLIIPVIEQEEIFLRNSFNLKPKQGFSDSATIIAAIGSDGFSAASQGVSSGSPTPFTASLLASKEALTSFTDSTLGAMMGHLFDNIAGKIEAAVCHDLHHSAGSNGGGSSIGGGSAGSSAAAATATAHAGGALNNHYIDGMSAIAMLAVLHRFSFIYTDMSTLQVNEEAEAASVAATLKARAQQQKLMMMSAGVAASVDGLATGGGGGAGAVSSSGMRPGVPGPAGLNGGLNRVSSVRVPRPRRTSSVNNMGMNVSMYGAAGTGSAGFLAGMNGGASNNTPALTVTVPPAIPATMHLSKVLSALELSLVNRVQRFTANEINWISSQKGDPKQAEIFAPIANFPRLLIQIKEMQNGMEMVCVDDLSCKLSRELISWLSRIASHSEKYANKMKVANFTYFAEAVGSLRLPVLASFVSNAAQQSQEATVKYVREMVSRQFPALASLADRIEEVGSRFSEEELSLFIRRKDVLNVVRELETKPLELSVKTLRERVKKHFQSEFDVGLQLVPRMWAQIKDRVNGILVRLEEAASASYQIKLDNGPKAVCALFDKYTD